MTVNFLTSPGTWFHPHVEELVQTCRERGHRSVCFTDHRELGRGDMLFVLSYYRILPAALIGNHGPFTCSIQKRTGHLISR